MKKKGLLLAEKKRLIKELDLYSMTDTVRVYRKTGMTLEADITQKNFHILIMKVNEIINNINKMCANKQ